MRVIIFALLFFTSISTFSQSCDLEFEGFENAGNFPIGWTVNGSYTNGTTAPNTGSYHAGFNTENDELISDVYACPQQLCFYWRTSGSTSDFKIDLSWSDDGGNTWNLLNSMNVQDTTNRTTYRQNCVDLSGVSFSNPSNVSFRFFQYNRVGGSWYLDDVCISSGGATQLQFATIPLGCNLVSNNFSVEVCAVDACGNVDNSFNGNITVSKNSGSGALSGTTTVAATNGCATFNDLQFNGAGTYSLSASASGLSSSTSGTFDLSSSCSLADTLVVMSYNLLNFPNGRNDCGTNITITNRVDTLKKILLYVQPDILMVCELQDEAGADLILNNALNVNGVTHYQRANFIANQSTSYKDLNNMFFYNSSKVSLKKQSEILTGTRDVGEYIIYGNDPNLAVTNDTTFIDFYVTHLKAGSTSQDITDRGTECGNIRTHIDAKPTGRNNIIGGDFNFYDAAEQGFQTLCHSGTYPFNDPISTEGTWSNNSTFAQVHTQSTRSSESIECGALGGVDDRFDFQLMSSNVLSGTDRVMYVANSYKNLGNNGSTFNKSINDVSNTSSVPREILNALYYMSDHLPIVSKIAIQFPNSNAPVPDLVSLSDVNAQCEVATLTTPTATDKDGNSVNGVSNVSLPITTQGVTMVTWTYTDPYGNSSIQIQKIIIQDVTVPVADVSSLSDVNAQCEVIVLTPPTATDNCDGAITATTSTSLPITAQGTTIVTWTYTDNAGNQSSQTQKVIIQDVTAPVADVSSLSDINAQCEVTTLTPPTATDNCDGAITATTSTSLPITAQGTTIVTWTYTDNAGNQSSQTQKVIIQDVTAPVADVSSLSDINAQCEVTVLTPPTATDNCDGAITATTSTSLPITAQGTTIVTWTYTDNAGNQSSQNQNINITPCPVGLIEQKNPVLSIYPNPSNDFVIITFDNSFEAEKIIELYDVFGKKVLGTKSRNTLLKLDVSSFSDGIYFIRISSKDYPQFIEKIIIE